MEASHHYHHHHHLSPLCPQHHHHLHHHHHPFHPQCVVHPHHVQHHHHHHPHHHHHHPSCILKPHCVPTQNPLPLPQDITNLEALEESELLLQEYVQIEEDEDDNEEPVFVMTDEWMEFFAKSEAKRQLEKKQAKILKKKEKKMNKGTE